MTTTVMTPHRMRLTLSMNICVSCKHSCYTVDGYYINETEHMCTEAKNTKSANFSFILNESTKQRLVLLIWFVMQAVRAMQIWLIKQFTKRE